MVGRSLRIVLLALVLLFISVNSQSSPKKYQHVIKNKTELRMLLMSSYPFSFAPEILKKTAKLKFNKIVFKKQKNNFRINIDGQTLSFSFTKKKGESFVSVNGREVRLILNKLPQFTKDIAKRLPKYANHRNYWINTAFAAEDALREAYALLVYPAIKPEVFETLKENLSSKINSCEKNESVDLEWSAYANYFISTMDCEPPKVAKAKKPVDEEPGLSERVDQKMKEMAERVDQAVYDWARKRNTEIVARNQRKRKNRMRVQDWSVDITSMQDPLKIDEITRWLTENVLAVESFVKAAKVKKAKPAAKGFRERPMLGLGWLQEHAAEFDATLEKGWDYFLRNSGSYETGTQPLLNEKADLDEIHVFKWLVRKANSLQARATSFRAEKYARDKIKSMCKDSYGLKKCLAPKIEDSLANGAPGAI